MSCASVQIMTTPDTQPSSFLKLLETEAFVAEAGQVRQIVGNFLLVFHTARNLDFCGKCLQVFRTVNIIQTIIQEYAVRVSDSRSEERRVGKGCKSRVRTSN